MIKSEFCSNRYPVSTDRDDDGEPLWDGSDGQADADVEHLEHGLALHAADGHDEPDHGEGVHGQLLAQRVHALLQRRPVREGDSGHGIEFGSLYDRLNRVMTRETALPGRVLGLHHAEDLAELGALAGADDDADAVAVDHERALKGGCFKCYM